MSLQNTGLRVVLGGEDVTDQIEGTLTYSNVDPGGFEACQFSFPRAVSVKRGTNVRVECGLETAWHGRVGGVGRTLAGKGGTQVTCEGYGSKLKRTNLSMVYVDRDLGGWGPISRGRRIALIDLARMPNGTAEISADETSGLPALLLKLTDPWNANTSPVAEALYDAGAGNKIAAFYYDWQRKNFTNTNWYWSLANGDQDDWQGTTNDSGDLQNEPNDTGSGYSTLASAQRYGRALLFWNSATAVTSEGFSYELYFRKLTVYGDHGLTRRGPDPGGFYPSDIVRHALQQQNGIDVGVIEDATGLIVPHSVYKQPTPIEKVIDDMGLLAAWHWGTWEPMTILGERPAFHFRSLPSSATCHVSRRDCDDLKLDERLDGLYNRVEVSYQDPARSDGVVTRTRTVAELDEAGETQTLAVNMGIGIEESAEAYGDILLGLSERAARAAGSAEISGDVGLPGGGTKPALLLKSGRDKLKVTDLPDLPLFESGRDEFQVKRVECTASKAGVSTSVELGTGADLIETLNARLSAETQLALGR